MKSSSNPTSFRTGRYQPRPAGIVRGFLTVLLGMTALAETAHAASATWNGTGATGNWTDTTWTGGAAPGGSGTTTSTDVATFASSGPATITVDTGRNVKGITFSGSSAYTLTGGSLVLSTGTSASGFLIQNTGTAAQTVNTAVTLEGAYTFDSSATSTANTLSFGGGVTAAVASTLTLQGSNTGSNTITGLANGAAVLSVAKSGLGTWIVSGSNSYTGSTAINTGTLALTGTLSGTSGISTGSSAVFSETTTGVFSGTGGINFNSTGTSSLLGANTFTGSVIISAGAVNFNSLSDTVANSLGLGTGNTIGLQSGSTLIYNGASNGSTGRTVTVGNSGGTSGAFSTLENDSTTSVLTFAKVSSAGTNNSTTSDFRLQGSTGGSGTSVNNVNGIISEGTGGNILTVTKAGTGIWELSGANTYGGKTTVSAGTLMINSATALGSGGLATTDQGTSVASGAVLDLNGISNVNETITLNGTGISGAGALINSNLTAASVKGGVISGLTLTSAGSGYSATPTVSITGGGGAGAAATATLGLTAASATVTAGGTGYTNGSAVTITGGGGTGAKATLNVTGGVITGITIVSAGSGYTSAPSFAVTGGTSGSLTGNATNFTVTGLTVTNAGTTAYTSAPTVSLGGNATVTATLSGVVLASSSSIGGTGDITLAGPVSDGGAGSMLTKVGANTLNLTATNSYSGGTTITAGTIALSGVGTLGSTSAALVDNSLLNLGGTSQTLGSLSGSGTVYNGTTGTVSTLSVSGSTASTFSGLIEDNAGAGSGTIALSKSGTGSLSLSNSTGNTYSGGTTISGGTVYANNAGGSTITLTPAGSTPQTVTANNPTSSATGSGAVLVKSGGTLAGSGTVLGAVTVQSGGTLSSGAAQSNVLSPSNPTGVDTVTGTGLTLTSSLGINAGSSLTFALGAGASTGALNYANPNKNSTYLSVTGTTSGEVNFGTGSAITINITDLTAYAPVGGDTLQLRVQNPYLLIAAASDSDYMNLYTTGGLDQNGLVLGVGSSLGSLTAFSLAVYDINGNKISSTTNYQNLQLYLYNGDLELVPEPGTWALMLGGMGVLVFWQRRKSGRNRF